jgi:hypothetical protein
MGLNSPGGSGSSGQQSTESQQGEFTFPPDEEFGEKMGREMEKAVQEMERMFEDGVPPHVRQTVINVIIIVVAAVLLLFIIGRILRYVSEVAIIKMVDDYEESGEKLGIRAGFRLGWSRQAWQLFLIDLLIGLPLFLLFLLLFGMIALIVISGFSGGEFTGALGAVAGIGMFFLVIFLAILTAVAVRVLKRFFYRSCVLEGQTVIDAISEGFGMVRQNFKDTGIMFLIMLGINIAWPIVMIPFGILFFGIGLLLGGGSALTVGGLSGVFSGDASVGAIIATVAVGVVMLILLVGLPLGFLNGLKITYESSAWTLTFRELRSLAQIGAGEPPALDEPAAA